MLRRAALALTVLLSVPCVGAIAPAQAADCSGVTVVVQFASGATTTGCAPGDPSSGLDALSGAGFSYTFAQGQPGFVCTIDGQPGDRNCMKPNYWAYFHGQPGGSWTYSNTGAGSYDPKPGSVEGWRFGGGAAPSTPPPGGSSTPTPSPTPKPTRRPVAKPSHRPAPTSSASSVPLPTASRAPVHHAGSRLGVSTTGPLSRHRHRAAPSASPLTSAATPSPSPSAQAARMAASNPSTRSGGSSLPWGWGALAVGVLGGGAAAGAVVRRRA